jgi:hypothetical protein
MSHGTIAAMIDAFRLELVPSNAKVLELGKGQPSQILRLLPYLEATVNECVDIRVQSRSE